VLIFFKKVADKAALDGVRLYDLRYVVATSIILNDVLLGVSPGGVPVYFNNVLYGVSL
jgi:hypothetical protein